MLGIIVPEGSSRAGYTSASLLQGVIAIVAGIVLLRGTVQDSAPLSPVDQHATRDMALQILGAYFLVRGIVALANPAVSMFQVQADLSFRASEFASAGVELLAGIVLISRPARVINVFTRHHGA